MSDQQQPQLDLTRRDTFRLFTPVTIRFCDTDMMGHVNNTSIAEYVEAARCELLYKLIEQSQDPDIDFVLARITLDFKREIKYPGTVEVGSRLARVGNRSMTTGYGVFIGDECRATAECVNVFWDPKARVSMVPSPKLRDILLAAAH
jgi:acyl-CoA thioester hydrolase